MLKMQKSQMHRVITENRKSSIYGVKVQGSAEEEPCDCSCNNQSKRRMLMQQVEAASQTLLSHRCCLLPDWS